MFFDLMILINKGIRLTSNKSGNESDPIENDVSRVDAE